MFMNNLVQNSNQIITKNGLIQNRRVEDQTFLTFLQVGNQKDYISSLILISFTLILLHYSRLLITLVKMFLFAFILIIIWTFFLYISAFFNENSFFQLLSKVNYLLLLLIILLHYEQYIYNHQLDQYSIRLGLIIHFIILGMVIYLLISFLNQIVGFIDLFVNILFFNILLLYSNIHLLHCRIDTNFYLEFRIIIFTRFLFSLTITLFVIFMLFSYFRHADIYILTPSFNCYSLIIMVWIFQLISLIFYSFHSFSYFLISISIALFFINDLYDIEKHEAGNIMIFIMICFYIVQYLHIQIRLEEHHFLYFYTCTVFQLLLITILFYYINQNFVFELIIISFQIISSIINISKFYFNDLDDGNILLKINYLVNLTFTTLSISFEIAHHLSTINYFDFWFYILYGVLFFFYFTGYFMYLTENYTYFWILIGFNISQQLILFYFVSYYVSFYLICLYFILIFILIVFIGITLINSIISSLILFIYAALFHILVYFKILNVQEIENSNIFLLFFSIILVLLIFINFFTQKEQFFYMKLIEFVIIILYELMPQNQIVTLITLSLIVIICTLESIDQNESIAHQIFINFILNSLQFFYFILGKYDLGAQYIEIILLLPILINIISLLINGKIFLYYLHIVDLFLFELGIIINPTQFLDSEQNIQIFIIITLWIVPKIQNFMLAYKINHDIEQNEVLLIDLVTSTILTIPLSISIFLNFLTFPLKLTINLIFILMRIFIIFIKYNNLKLNPDENQDQELLFKFHEFCIIIFQFSYYLFGFYQNYMLAFDLLFQFIQFIQNLHFYDKFETYILILILLNYLALNFDSFRLNLLTVIYLDEISLYVLYNVLILLIPIGLIKILQKSVNDLKTIQRFSQLMILILQIKIILGNILYQNIYILENLCLDSALFLITLFDLRNLKSIEYHIYHSLVTTISNCKISLTQLLISLLFLMYLYYYHINLIEFIICLTTKILISFLIMYCVTKCEQLKFLDLH